jgi:hypothetical protein
MNLTSALPHSTMGKPQPSPEMFLMLLASGIALGVLAVQAAFLARLFDDLGFPPVPED